MEPFTQNPPKGEKIPPKGNPKVSRKVALLLKSAKKLEFSTFKQKA